MNKKTLWLVTVAVLCCCFAVIAIGNGIGKAPVAQKNAVAAAAPALKAATSPVVAGAVNAATKKVETVSEVAPVSNLGNTTKAEVSELSNALASRMEAAKAVYDRWLATGTATLEEKALMEELIFVSNERTERDNSIDATGGPDAYQYRFVDNQAPDTKPFYWYDLCADGAATNGPTGDDGGMLITWGWSFPYYGGNFTGASITTNGLVHFGATASDTRYSNVCISAEAPTAGQPEMMPYWDDCYAPSGGGCGNTGVGPWVRYRSFGSDSLIIQWTNMPHISMSTDRYSFQVILYSSGTFKYMYNTGWISTYGQADGSTIGIDASGAGNGLEYKCQLAGNQITGGRAIRWFIQAISGVDLRVSALSPCGNNPPNPTQSVSLRVTNFGTTAAAATTARFSFDGGVTTGSAAVPALTPSSFFDVFFATTVNLTAGTHTLAGHADAVAGEAAIDTSNNTQSCVPNGFVCYDATADLTGGPYTNSAAPSGDDCVLRSGQDYVYRVIIPTAANYTFTLCPTATSWDSYIFLTDACCGGTTIAFNDDDYTNCVNGALSTILCVALNAGTYYLDVEPFSTGGAGAPFTVDMHACLPCGSPPPANDACANAGAPVAVPPNATFTGNNECATHDCGLLTAGQGKTWHAFTVGAGMDVTVDYCTTGGSWGNFYFVLVSGCPCGSTVQPTNWNLTACAPNLTSFFSNLAAGTYYIPVLFDSTNAARGAYTVHVSAVPHTTPPGDVCATALPLTIGVQYDGTTVGATNDYDAVCPYTGSTSPDMVYSYTPATNQDVTFSLCLGTTNYDTKLYVYAGTCGSGEIACNDDACTAPLFTSPYVSTVECVALTAGVTYYIVVDGYGGASGNYLLLATTCVPCVITQQGGDLTEPTEPWPVNATFSTDDIDGGCNNTVPTFGPTLTVGGAPVFGKTFLYLDTPSGLVYRDTDWYPFTLASTSQVTLTAVGEIQVDALIVGGPCPGTVLASAESVHSCSLAVATICLPAGNYWAFVGGVGSAVSAAPVNYRAWLTSTVCPTGRCCYGDPGAPQCQNVDAVACATLSGAWDGTTTCELIPCPQHLSCAGLTGAIQMSQYPFNADEAWAGVTSEVSQGYLDAENFSVAGPIGQVRFWGLDAAFSTSWAACDEDPMPFIINFVADSSGYPSSTPVCSYSVSLTRTATAQNYSGFPLWQYDATLAPACAMTSGWITIQGDGLTTCWFLWAASPVGDGIMMQYNAGWGNPGYGDYALCLSTGCDVSAAPVQCTVMKFAGNLNVRFNAPVAGQYILYSTTDKTIDFPNVGWAVESTINAVAGVNLYTDPTPVLYKRYVVTHNCP